MPEAAGSAVVLPVARATPVAPGRGRTNWLVKRPLLAVGLALVCIIVLTAAIAPLLPLRDPNVTAPARRLAGAGVNGYLLGSDQLGRDLLSRLVWGARVSMVVAAIAATVAFVLGGAVGLLAGFYGRLVDNVLMRLIDILMAFPYVLLAIALVAALGPGLLNALIAIAIVNISFYARGVRAAVIVVRQAAFIEASRALGASDVRILLREVLPNIAPPLLVFLTLNVGALIVETAGLSFIGLGAQPPTADLGTMLADGRQFMMTAPHVAAIPGVAVLALVWGLNMVGDGLRDMLDPTLAHTTR
ncbi:MAG: ABC transporter permease [Chloroflexi bacterium]|nr:ABC transporter permease [Chloroflexota bacterium]